MRCTGGKFCATPLAARLGLGGDHDGRAPNAKLENLGAHSSSTGDSNLSQAKAGKDDPMEQAKAQVKLGILTSPKRFCRRATLFGATFFFGFDLASTRHLPASEA